MTLLLACALMIGSFNIGNIDLVSKPTVHIKYLNISTAGV